MLHDYPAAQLHRSDMMRHMVLNVLHGDVNESLGCATRSRAHLEGCERHPLTRTDTRRKGGASVTLRRTVFDRLFRRPSCRGVGLPKWGYRHERQVILGSGDPAHLAMPRVNRVISLLNRWWLGTYLGAYRPQHLDYYLDEFTFRFIRHASRSRGKLSYRLVQQSAAITLTPYQASWVGVRSRTGTKCIPITRLDGGDTMVPSADHSCLEKSSSP